MSEHLNVGLCVFTSIICEWLHVDFNGFNRFEYESTDSSTEEMKKKFAPTMEFVEEYLKDVLNQAHPFEEKAKNELTLEVG